MESDKEAVHDEILKLLRENAVLVKENNEYLRKMHRYAVIGMTFRTIWYGLLIGLPFAVYFYVLEPYFNAFGANYELFRKGMAEIPGLKGIENILPSIMQ